jgi:hypothetical protein
MRFLIGMGLLGLTLGCDGKDGATDSGGDDSGDVGGEVPADVQAVFDTHCTPCHVNGGSSGSLNLDSENAYGNLVDQDALVGGTRVSCGDSEGSVLYTRLEEGSMPQAGRLDPEDPILTVKAWIDGGC